MAAALAQAADSQRIPLITVEPFAAPSDTTTPVLQQVASGQLDDELIQLADVVRRWSTDRSRPMARKWT
jgi:hypothetical protein